MIKATAGAVALIARKVVADPIVRIDEMFGSGKPPRRAIRIEVDFKKDDKSKPLHEKDLMERTLAEEMIDPEIGRQVNEQLKLYGCAEVVVIIRDADKDFIPKHDKLHETIVKQYETPIGVQAGILSQRVSTEGKDPCVVLQLNKTG